VNTGLQRVGHPLLWLGLTGLLVTVAIPAWLQPEQRVEEQSRPVVSTAALAYTADVPPNPVSSKVRSGDVVFLNIVETVMADVRWEVPDPTVRVTDGELRVRVVLTSSTGWQRVLTTGPTVPITDSGASARLPIDFGRALRTAAEIDERVGVAGTTSVDVSASVRFQGQVLSGAGPTVVVRDTANFTWGFTLTPLTATPKEVSAEQDAEALPTGLDRSGSQERVHFVTIRDQVATSVDILGRSVPLAVIRAALSIGIALFLLLTILALIGRGLLRRRGEAATIAAHNADRLVAVERIPAKRRAAALTVTDFAALRAMSREHGLLILSHDTGTHVEYYLVDGAVTYRYATKGGG
jgi:hypothetical protein